MVVEVIRGHSVASSVSTLVVGVVGVGIAIAVLRSSNWGTRHRGLTHCAGLFLLMAVLLVTWFER